MPKEEWGVKRVCPKCTVRFYDLQNDPMTCPSCGATFDVASLTQQKTRSAAAEKVTKVVEPAPAEDIEDVVVLEDDDDDSAEDIADDLLDDDDDEDDAIGLEEIADMPVELDEN
jgi:uncharacterized protein (TIGR02300 family)